MSRPPEQPTGPSAEQPEDVPPVPSPDEVAAELAAEPVEQGRRYPSTIGGACYLAVLAGTAVGLAITAAGDWRTGIRWVAGALLAAGLLRLALPGKDAGMLAVRHRALDAALYAGLAAALAVLTVSIPGQPV